MALPKQRDSKLFMKEIIKQVELEAKNSCKRNYVKNYDLYPTLPNKLRQRVAKIIPLKLTRKPTEKLPELIEKQEDSIFTTVSQFNESTCSLVERKEEEHYELSLELPIEMKQKKKKRYNWFSTYICAPQKERVKWKSKIYETEGNIWEKPLEEQAEYVMDVSAKEFAHFFNELGTKDGMPLEKDQLEALFPIEPPKEMFESIHTEPKEIKAVPKVIADRWHTPKMSMELKYEQVLANLKRGPKKTGTVAFGTTLSYKDRQWVRDVKDMSFKSVFPDEIQSGKNLFQGLCHLRSTNKFIEFCKDNPKFPRSKYLEKEGYFTELKMAASHTTVPFYELLQIK